MLKSILNITICPQDDRFEILGVNDSYKEGFYEISINTLVDESFQEIVTNEDYIQKIIDDMEFGLGFDEFKSLFPFYKYTLKHCRDKGFFTNFEQIYIYGLYEDIVVYLKNNPELLDKEIVLAESLELDKNTCKRLKEVFKDFPNIKLMIQGNTELISISEYEQTIEAIDNIVNKIQRYNYSSLEQLILAYDLIRDRFYIMEDDSEKYSVSRDLTSTLLGDKIVCVGFANIFNAVCEKLNIKSMVFLLERKDKEDVGHARNMLHLVDDKYEIDGIYFFDPTFDCKKDEGNNFLFSYRFFAKDYIEMDELSGGIYVPREFKLFDEDNFDDFLELVEDLPGNLQLAFRLLTHYRLTFLLKFIDREIIEPLAPGYEPVQIVDAAYDIKCMAEKSIGAETFLKALYTVRKNQYYENPQKYIFDVDALSKIITNSRFRADGSAELSLLSMMGFNYYYGKKASEEKVKEFMTKNDLDKDIERTKIVRLLRTVLEEKIEEESAGKKL